MINIGDDMNIQQYNEIAERLKPKVNVYKNALYAFLFGGTIGAIGQILLFFYTNYLSYSEKQATSLMSVTLILIGSLLTALGLYDKLSRFAGAGTFIPITGFANSMTSCALDSKSEGLIVGIGCNMFKLAGCVITYGIVSSSLLGVIRYVFSLF